MVFGTMRYGVHGWGTFRSTLEQRCAFLLMFLWIDKEKGNMQGIIVVVIALFVTVVTSTIEHLA